MSFFRNSIFSSPSDFQPLIQPKDSSRNEKSLKKYLIFKRVFKNTVLFFDFWEEDAFFWYQNFFGDCLWPNKSLHIVVLRKNHFLEKYESQSTDKPRKLGHFGVILWGISTQFQQGVKVKQNPFSCQKINDAQINFLWGL